MIKLISQDNEKTAQQLSTEKIEGLASAQFSKLLKNKCVHLNGCIIKKDTTLKQGDILELFVENMFYDLIPMAEIVYEDENMLIYNKPAGMACEYPENTKETTILSLAQAKMKQTREYNPDILAFPYLCTAHARQTAGLTVVAKDENTYLAFSEAIRQRRIRRFYTAITSGTPPRHKGEIHSYISSSHKKGTLRVQDVPGNMAQPAVTRYSVLSSSRGIALVDIEPITNIPFQIQAQFKYIGHPVLGSQKYADRSANSQFGAFNDLLWLKRIEFCVGENNALSYLNGASFSLTKTDLPYFCRELDID